MGYVAAASAGINFASSIIGGIGQDAYYSNQADWANYYAIANANEARKVGEWNAKAIEDTATLNNLVTLTLANAEATSIENIAEFNAELRVATGEYNARLMEQEAEDLLVDLELDEFYVNRAVEQYIGKSRTSYAGAGVALNTGAPVDMEVDARTQQALETFVLRHNADRAVRKLYDSAAMSRWQADTEAASIMFNADIQKTLTQLRGLSTVFVNTANAERAVEASIIDTNNKIRQILNNGTWTANAFDQKGDAAFVGGLFNAATGLINDYSKGAFESIGLSPSSLVAAESPFTESETPQQGYEPLTIEDKRPDYTPLLERGSTF